MKSTIAVTVILVGALSGCNASPSSADKQQRQQQESLAKESNMQVGMPAITNFQEKRTLKMILELRDQSIATVTYTQDMTGKLHKLCDSIGFGIPYSTQYTNPQYIAYTGSQVGVATLPQPDPNGLFSPAAAEGTWILCLNPDTKKIAPLYVEPRVIVSPFALQQ